MPVRTERARRMSPDERRESLVAAALPLVLRHGPAVTTRQIAEAADVAEGTIFRVFEDKDALVKAVTLRALDPGPMLAELRAVDRSLPLRERLTAVVEIQQRRLDGVFTLIDALGLNGPPRPARTAHGPTASMNADVRDVVVELIGPDAHRLRHPPEETAHLLRLLTFSATHPRISDGAPLSARRIVDTLLDGLLAPTPAHGGAPC